MSDWVQWAEALILIVCVIAALDGLRRGYKIGKKEVKR